MKVLLIDFYDSFTYNIFHYLESLGANVTVCLDDQVQMNDIDSYDCIIFSPGPGLPDQTFSMKRVLEHYHDKKKILGICLGMQGISTFFGAELYNQKQVKHGVQEKAIIIKNDKLFENISTEFPVGLYHSWAIDIEKAKNLVPLAVSENKALMVLKHKNLPIYGIQFHPESILTPDGKTILQNFLNL